MWECSLDCPSHLYLKDVEKIILEKSPPTHLRESTPWAVRNSLWAVGIMQGQAEQPRGRNILGVPHGDYNHGEAVGRAFSWW